MWSLFCGLTGGKAGSAMTWSKGTCGMKGARGLCMKPPRPPRPNPRPPRPVRTMVPIDQIKFVPDTKTSKAGHKIFNTQNAEKVKTLTKAARISQNFTRILSRNLSYSILLSSVQIISWNKIFFYIFQLLWIGRYWRTTVTLSLDICKSYFAEYTQLPFKYFGADCCGI